MPVPGSAGLAAIPKHRSAWRRSPLPQPGRDDAASTDRSFALALTARDPAAMIDRRRLRSTIPVLVSVNCHRSGGFLEPGLTLRPG